MIEVTEEQTLVESAASGLSFSPSLNRGMNLSSERRFGKWCKLFSSQIHRLSQGNRAGVAKIYKARRLVNWSMVRLSLRFIRQQGLIAYLIEIQGKLLRQQGYAKWIGQHEPGQAELDQQRHSHFAYEPTISIIVPTFNTQLPFLTAMVESVKVQTYGNWELCIADGNSESKELRKQLRQYTSADSRIRVAFLPENRGIAGNSNAALGLATGKFVALLDHDDLLAPFALFEVVRAINDQPDADVLYSDEDKIDIRGEQRRDHHFKPDWSPDVLRGHNYITHLVVFCRELLEKIQGFRAGFDGSQDYDLILRATEKARSIIHIPKVLYHWRAHPTSVAGNLNAKIYAFEAGRQALAEHLHRCGLPGTVEHGPVLGTYQAKYRIGQRPLVSILVIDPQRPRFLARCLRAIEESNYPNLEILVATPGKVKRELPSAKGPAVRRIAWDGSPGKSPICNDAAGKARGEVLVFLRPDLVPLHPDWLERMLEHVLRPGVGAVGPKVYSRDRSVKDAGYILGITGIYRQHHRHFLRGAPGYGCRLVTTQNLSGVSSSCLMTTKAVFEEVGGFDPGFVGSGYDLDYCMRVRKLGYWIVWTPHAQLTCPRFLSRDLAEKNLADQKLFREKWGEAIRRGDPFYNPNLTLDWEDFSLRRAG